MIVIVTRLGGNGPTGVEAHIKSIAEAAHQRSIPTRLVTPYTDKTLFYRILFRFANIMAYYLPDIGNAVIRKISEWRMSRAIRSLKNSVTERTVFYAQDPTSANAVLTAAPGEFLATVVHYNRSEADELILRGIAKKNGIASKASHAAELRALRMANMIIFVSDFMRSEVNQRLPELSEVPQKTIPNFVGRPKVDIKNGPTADIISIGTLEPRKNQVFLLEVLKICKDRGHTYTATIVGSGPDSCMLKEKADSLGISNQIRFVGFQAAASLLIPGHKLLFHSARSENLPITLIEALSCGCPILAAPVGGIPEIYSDGTEGRYIDIDDASHSATILISELEDESVRFQHSCNARLSYRAKFDTKHLSEMLLKTLVGDEACT